MFDPLPRILRRQHLGFKEFRDTRSGLWMVRGLALKPLENLIS
jgi:hypothetical protein